MGTLSEDIMYSSQQINVPLNLPYILKQYAKAAIKTQPRDLLHWSSAYFRALANGDVPPVKDRIEYPLISTPSGLTAGFLRILIKQFGKSGIVEEKDLIKKWKGVGLEINELQSMLKLCGFRKTVRWLNFVAVAAGFLSPNLTQTMILICELLTDEPEGGSAAIMYQTFMTLYIYLARMDCGPVCHLKSNMADTFSAEVSADDLVGKAETETEKSSEKLSDIEVALERKPTLDSNDSANGVMVWEDITHPDLVQETTTEENVVTEDIIADNIPIDVVDEPTTAVNEEEKADDQESVKSTESYDNTGITLKFHDSEQDVKIDDYTGPIEPKLKKRFEKKLEEEEEKKEEQKEETNDKTDADETKENDDEDNKEEKGEEQSEEKTNTEEEVVEEDNKEKDENTRDSTAEDEIEQKEVEENKTEDKVEEEDEIEQKVEESEGDKDDEERKEDVEEEEEEVKEDVKEEEEEVKNESVPVIAEEIKETDKKEESKEGEKTPTPATKKRKKKKGGDDEEGKKGEEEGGEEEESDHEEQSRYEFSLELEEEEEEEKAGEEETKSVKEELAVDESDKEDVEKRVVEEEEEAKEEEEGEEEELKEEQSDDILKSIDSAFPIQGQRKSEIEVYGCLHLPKHRNLSFTDSLVSEPDNHFWVNVPGIGPLVPEKQILSLKAYFQYCSERQSGYVMPRNIKHHLCPCLEAPVVELEKRSSTDVEWINDVVHGDG